MTTNRHRDTGEARPETNETNLSWLAGTLPTSSVFTLGLDVARALDRLDGYGLSHGRLRSEEIQIIETPSGLRAALVETNWENDTDPGRDIAGLGRVLYEMIAGEEPRAPGDQLPYPRHAPNGLRQVIARCLPRDPGQRFASLAEVIAALQWAEAEYHRTKEDFVIDDRWEHWFSEGDRLAEGIELLGARRGREVSPATRLRAMLSSLAVGLIVLTTAATAVVYGMQ